MEFRNLTPFDALCYGALDPGMREHRVVAMKVAYRLVPVAGEPGRCLAEVIDEDPPALCTADAFYGEDGTSSVCEESDLAPYKPKCDVLVRGHAHAPRGQPARDWDVRVRLGVPLPPPSIDVPPPQPLAPGMALTPHQQVQWREAKENAEQRRAAAATERTLLNKTLHVTGPREFRHGLGGWRSTRPAPAATVPLRWEHAFGGRSVVPNPKHDGDSDASAFLLNEVCFSNPIGCGWIEQRHEAMARKAKRPLERMPAPQIEPADWHIRGMVVAKHPEGELTAAQMVEQAQRYGAVPAGFGAVGRAWAPRLALAGSYGETWLKNRWPQLPEDFDFGYWNCAPADQQIEYLPPGTRVELWNLTDPVATPDGHLCVDLPQHKPFVLLRLANGAMVPLPLLTDTIIIDTDAMTITLTHRTSIPQGTPVRVAEARFETDPAAPLLKLAPPDKAMEGA